MTVIQLGGAQAVAVGASHCLAIAVGGVVVAWGDNEHNQLDVPAGLTDVIAIAAGNNHSLALTRESTVVAWGQWSYGCTEVPSDLNDVVAVAAGSFHSLALKRDGTVVEWGHKFSDEYEIASTLTEVVAIASNASERIALRRDGTVVSWGGRMRGVTPPFPLAGAHSVDIGSEHALVLTNEGAVLSWGPGTDTSTNVPDGLSGVVAVAAVGSDSFAVKEDGTVAAWGESGSDNLRVPANLKNVKAIAVGFGCSLALLSDGSLVVWGRASNGEHYVPESLWVTRVDQSPYSAEEHQRERVISIATGQSHSLALRADGTVVAWGNGSQGELDVPPHLRGVVAIAAGWSHSLALKKDGTVVSWGDMSGEAQVPIGLADVVAIAAGRGHCVALRRNGTVVAWGYPEERVSVPADLVDVVAIAAGVDHNLALLRDGSISSWGDTRFSRPTMDTGFQNVVAITAGGHPNGSQQFIAVLRDGSVVKVASSAFAEEGNVPHGLPPVTAIAAGSTHSIAITRDGTVVAWGAGGNGQLDVPDGLHDVVAIAAHGSHNLALTSAGLVAGWGTSKRGALAIPAKFRMHLASSKLVEDVPAATQSPLVLSPIVETMSGDYSFLRGLGTSSDPLRVDWRSEPFSGSDSLERLLKASRVMNSISEQGRILNNLAATHLASASLEEALRAIQEAESLLVETMNGSYADAGDQTRLALAAVRYNASFLLLLAGDYGRNFEYADVTRRNAVSTLAEVEVRTGKWKFLNSALVELEAALRE